MPVEVLSNQASKQPGTINNAFKMQRVLFHKSHDIENKLLIIIHADKMRLRALSFFRVSFRALTSFSSVPSSPHLLRVRL